MKYKRVLAISIVAVLLVSLITFGLSILSKALVLGAYAQQIQITEEQENGEGTTVSLTLFGNPGDLQGVLDAFAYFTASDLEWSGNIAPMGPGSQTSPPFNIELNFSYVEAQKLDEFYNYNVYGEELGLNLVANDLINILVQSETVNVEIEFWQYLDTFPSMNLTAALEGSVVFEVYLDSILPFTGLRQVLYSYRGESFIINLCVIQPLVVDIIYPTDGQMVNHWIRVKADIQAVPGITLENVAWDVYHEHGSMGWQGMEFNITSGFWESSWPTHFDTPNGGCEVVVKADGREERPLGVEDFWYSIEDRVNVEVANPWVESYVIKQDGNGQWEEQFEGLQIDFELQMGEEESIYWSKNTPFSFWPYIGPDWSFNMTAPEELNGWMFHHWAIEGTDLESGDNKLQIDESIYNQLFEESGRGRLLRCIYEENPPPE